MMMMSPQIMKRQAGRRQLYLQTNFLTIISPLAPPLVSRASVGPCLLTVSLEWTLLPPPPFDVPYAQRRERNFQIKKDAEDVQEKKNPSSVMSVGLYSYIQQVMKSSSLGWFIDWQELESKVTAGLAISCCGSVFVGSNFQHEGKRKACVKQAAPRLRSWAGKGSSTPTLPRKEKDCSLKKHHWEGQHP